MPPSLPLDWSWAAVPGAALHTPTALTCLVHHASCVEWLEAVPAHSVHAIVTDPPYSPLEFDDANQAKLRAGKGGVWRKPPVLGGVQRAPLPRFTVLSPADRVKMAVFFQRFAQAAARALVPGGHLILASNPLVSTTAFAALEAGGLEKRGEIIRVVKTLRGGDRPKGFEVEFAGVSAMPKSCWEPWGLFRTAMSEKTVGQNLRKWGTGGLRRTPTDEPFRDLIVAPPARGEERRLAPHPSLKPQGLLRALVHASLPLGEGIVLDPFAGSGSTLAAAQAIGYRAIGVERDRAYLDLGLAAVPALATLEVAPTS